MPMKAPSRSLGPRKLRAAPPAPAVLAVLFPKLGAAPFWLPLDGRMIALIMLIFIFYFKSLAHICTLIYHKPLTAGASWLPVIDRQDLKA